jgi:hypothetical protein
MRRTTVVQGKACVAPYPHATEFTTHHIRKKGPAHHNNIAHKSTNFTYAHNNNIAHKSTNYTYAQHNNTMAMRTKYMYAHHSNTPLTSWQNTTQKVSF